MKRTIKILAAVLLLCNTAAALYGGWELISYPDGSSLQLSTDYLHHTPFNDYLLPGIILFMANGLFGCIVLAALAFSIKYYPRLVIAQGIILSCWILAEILLLHHIRLLHLPFGITGLLLVYLGAWLHKQGKPYEGPGAD